MFVISAIWVLGLLFLIIYVAFKTQIKSKKTKLSYPNLELYQASFLMLKDINYNTFIASIYKLMCNKKIVVADGKLILKNKRVLDNDLNLLNILFDDSNEVNIASFDTDNYKKELARNYYFWKNNCLKDVNISDYFINTTLIRKQGLTYSLFGLSLFMIGTIIKIKYFYIYILLFFIVLGILYFGTFIRYNEKGREEYRNIKHIKKNINENKISDIDKSMIYALMFELDYKLARKLSKEDLINYTSLLKFKNILLNSLNSSINNTKYEFKKVDLKSNKK